VLATITVVCSVVMYFTWYRRLPVE